MTRVAGLVLAAGGGTRFGKPKILVRLADRYLVEYVADALLSGGCVAPIVVVGGAAWEEAAAALRSSSAVQHRRLRLVHNTAWSAGLATSLRTGLDALAASHADAVVVALGDQPGITSLAVRRVIRAFQTGARIAAAKYGDRRAHPVLLSRDCWSEAVRLAAGDEGARSLMRAHPDWVTEIWCDDLVMPVDVDTLTDLEAAERQLRERSVDKA